MIETNEQHEERTDTLQRIINLLHGIECDREFDQEDMRQMAVKMLRFDKRLAALIWNAAARIVTTPEVRGTMKFSQVVGLREGVRMLLERLWHEALGGDA